jgi:hypothetical protein
VDKWAIQHQPIVCTSYHQAARQRAIEHLSVSGIRAAAGKPRLPRIGALQVVHPDATDGLIELDRCSVEILPHVSLLEGLRRAKGYRSLHVTSASFTQQWLNAENKMVETLYPVLSTDFCPHTSHLIRLQWNAVIFNSADILRNIR